MREGHEWLFLALFTTYATDTNAYFVGKLFGEHKMAPKVSPGKTWEGAFGGICGGLAAAIIVPTILGLELDTGHRILLGLTLPTAAILGDLFESLLKRRLGVKDFSSLVPGHGGVTDRLDSLLFAVPITYYYLHWVVL
jgi:phosphatidate cytidylyltransferase